MRLPVLHADDEAGRAGLAEAAAGGAARGGRLALGGAPDLQCARWWR